MMKTKLFRIAFILLVVVGILDLSAEKFYLYEYVWWMDMLVHFLAGACVGVATLLVYSFKKNPNTVSLARAISIAMIGAAIIGLLWEVYELIFGITAFSDGINYVTDTVSDLIMDTAGGLLASLYGYRHLKIKQDEQK